MYSFGFGGLWRIQLTMGIALLVMGILIAVFPEILVIMVSAAIIMAGLGLIGSALRAKKFEQATRARRVEGPFDM